MWHCPFLPPPRRGLLTGGASLYNVQSYRKRFQNLHFWNQIQKPDSASSNLKISLERRNILIEAICFLYLYYNTHYCCMSIHCNNIICLFRRNYRLYQLFISLGQHLNLAGRIEEHFIRNLLAVCKLEIGIERYREVCIIEFHSVVCFFCEVCLCILRLKERCAAGTLVRHCL